MSLTARAVNETSSVPWMTHLSVERTDLGPHKIPEMSEMIDSESTPQEMHIQKCIRMSRDGRGRGLGHWQHRSMDLNGSLMRKQGRAPKKELDT